MEFLLFFFIGAGLYAAYNRKKENEVGRRRGEPERSLVWAFFWGGFVTTLLFALIVFGLIAVVLLYG